MNPLIRPKKQQHNSISIYISILFWLHSDKDRLIITLVSSSHDNSNVQRSYSTINEPVFEIGPGGSRVEGRKHIKTRRGKIASTS